MALACLAGRRLAPAAAAVAAADATRSGRCLLLHCRAVASKVKQPEVVYNFDRAQAGAPIFPELLQPGRRAVLLAVDPDIHGAIAAVSWLNPPATAQGDDGSCSSDTTFPAASTSSAGLVPLQTTPMSLLPPLDQLSMELHDMPVEIWKYGKRDKKQPEAEGLIHILQRYADMAAGTGTGAFGVENRFHSVKSSKHTWEAEEASEPAAKVKRRRKGKAAENTDTGPEPRAAAEAAVEEIVNGAASNGLASSAVHLTIDGTAGAPEQPPIVRAVIEYSMPSHICGKYAWYGIGFAVGLLNGLLAAQGIPYQRVPASTWKPGMGLKKQGKDGSIALARHLLPTSAIFLKRKKDHGRAEALLMAAWTLGIRMNHIGVVSDSSSDEAATTDSDAEEEGEE